MSNLTSATWRRLKQTRKVKEVNQTKVNRMERLQ
jgi:hypothetical protein